MCPTEEHLPAYFLRNIFISSEIVLQCKRKHRKWVRLGDVLHKHTPDLSKNVGVSALLFNCLPVTNKICVMIDLDETWKKENRLALCFLAALFFMNFQITLTVSIIFLYLTNILWNIYLGIPGLRATFHYVHLPWQLRFISSLLRPPFIC